MQRESVVSVSLSVFARDSKSDPYCSAWDGKDSTKLYSMVIKNKSILPPPIKILEQSLMSLNFKND